MGTLFGREGIGKGLLRRTMKTTSRYGKISKEYMLRQIEKYEENIIQNKSSLIRIYSSRDILREIYDENFAMIEKSEKGSWEHLKLLCIEDLINSESAKMTDNEINAESRIENSLNEIRKIKRKIKKLLVRGK
ncbi:MAG: hypothetical protein HC880_00450 [Bacteroidia bacterium]|nr:hypothetical protein [Bacteroidia bacterium]